MKKLLTIAIVLASASAFATRARLTALGNAEHLADVSYMYFNPSEIMAHADSLTIETGDTTVLASAPASDAAEGLMIRSMGDAKFALGLGHKDAWTHAMRSHALTNAGASFATLVAQQNPLQLAYSAKSGDMAWGAGLVYSNFKSKTGTEPSESSMGLKFGAQAAAWTASLGLGLTDSWKNDLTTNQDEYKGKSAINLYGSYMVSEELMAYGNYVSGGYKTTNDSAGSVSADRDYSMMSFKVGVLSSMKKDGSEVFYGAAILNQTETDKSPDGLTLDNKVTSTEMPLIIGMEVAAASWLTVRGSVTQDLLLMDSEKTTNGTTTASETSPGTNSTTLAAGAGLKFDKLTLDGTLAAATSQTLDFGAGNLLGTVGLTYNF